MNSGDIIVKYLEFLTFENQISKHISGNGNISGEGKHDFLKEKVFATD